jgi:tRNA A37 threonylcarbamoyladenosine synthetase subunit TsaC/SUA5/YrdC
MSVTPPARDRIFDIADARHRARVVDAVSGGAPMGYWFGNFCVIGSRPARSAFLRINRAKGRPDEQPGSVVTTSERLVRMFDWSLLPGGIDRDALVAALAALVGLGPIGMRGPATDTIPAHLSAWDGGVRTVQVVLPGRSCPSNVLVDELLDRIGGDVIFGTSANVSKVRTGRVTASHNEMRAFVAEFGGWSDMVFVGPVDEAAARAAHPRHLPGSTSLLSFHRRATADGRAAVVLERHGSLAPEVIRGVLAGHGLGLVLADGARHRLPMRELDAAAPMLAEVSS